MFREICHTAPPFILGLGIYDQLFRVNDYLGAVLLAFLLPVWAWGVWMDSLKGEAND
jgi:hypothetical protein